MVNVTKVGEDPPLELHCPRGCGKLRYGRSAHYIDRGKTNNCKQCKGVMLTLDELQIFENRGIKRFNKLRKNKLRETLNTGKVGSLDCPKCKKIMVEIELFYKKGRYMAKQEEATNLGNFIRGLPIIWVIEPIIDLASDLKDGKLNKSVTIDACHSCFIFWFDKTELSKVMANDVVTKYDV